MKWRETWLSTVVSSRWEYIICALFVFATHHLTCATTSQTLSSSEISAHCYLEFTFFHFFLNFLLLGPVYLTLRQFFSNQWQSFSVNFTFTSHLYTHLYSIKLNAPETGERSQPLSCLEISWRWLYSPFYGLDQHFFKPISPKIWRGNL